MKTTNSLYPIPLHEFVLVLQSENANNWGDHSLDWIVDKLALRKDYIFYHKSANKSSLSAYVKKKRISLEGKTAHCDVQHYIWKLNTGAGNEKSPIDSLWTNNKVIVGRDHCDPALDGSITGMLPYYSSYVIDIFTIYL